jgi:hypothetical protein
MEDAPLGSGRDEHDQGGARTSREQLGFGWGYLWIVLGFFQGGIALVFGFIAGMRTEYLPNRAVSLLVGLPLLVSAYGLLKRRSYGFFTAGVLAALMVVSGLVGVFTGRPAGVAGLLFGSLWLLYFYRRRDWFT